MKKKAFIAMSGGVDSSVAAFLVKRQGFECIGATMKLFDYADISAARQMPDISEGTADAAGIARQLDMPYHVFDLSGEFKKQVINKFISSYQNGETPNPCVDCNRYLKFSKLFECAMEQGADYAVTGHYARIEYDNETGHYLLKKAVDESKDQSYVLYSLTQEQLKRTIFPLGTMRKSEIRNIAAGQGFSNAAKSDSQDICFIPDGDYASFIERYTGKTFESGDFIDLHSNVLGRHRGLIRYTIGQRKGLGLALPRPMYVHSKNAEDNTITLCYDNELYRSTLTATDFNLTMRSGTADDIYTLWHSPMRCAAKIRYGHKAAPATAEAISDDSVRIVFDEPQRAIAKGQAVVLYDGDVVIGGGRIT